MAVHDGGIILSLIFVAIGIGGTWLVNRYLTEVQGFVRILLLLFLGMMALQSAAMFSQRLMQLNEERKNAQ